MIGNQFISRTLGEGGFGKVYEGYHINRKCENVAIKVSIDKNKSHKKKGLDKYLIREIATPLSINSDFLLKTIDVFFKDNNPVIVQELATGDLQSFNTHFHNSMKDQNGFFTDYKNINIFKEVWVRKIIFSMINGLFELHRNSIVHRDIKPDNILYFNKDEQKWNNHTRFKICDYGLARKIKESKFNKFSYVGTTSYLAPEFYLQSQIKIVPAIDMWAVGCVMQQLWNNEHFIGDHDKNNMHVSQNCEILNDMQGRLGCPNDKVFQNKSIIQQGNYKQSKPLFKGLSEEGQDLFYKLCHWKAKQRISSKRALTHPWFKKDINNGHQLNNIYYINPYYESRIKCKKLANDDEDTIQKNNIQRLDNLRYRQAQTNRFGDDQDMYRKDYFNVKKRKSIYQNIIENSRCTII